VKKIVLLIIIIIIGVSFYYKEQIIHLDFFNVKKIEISESKHYNFDSLLKEVIPKKKVSVFDIDLSDLEKRLFKLSWVKKVTISKILPDKLYVTITEHEVKGVVLFDKIYYYNNDYKVFLKPNVKEVEDYIIFSGLKKEDYENSFELFKNHILEMENIATVFKDSDLNSLDKIDEIYPSNSGYRILLKSGTKLSLKNKNYLLAFNRSKKIIEMSKERKEIITTIIFDQLKSKNKVIVKIGEEKNNG